MWVGSSPWLQEERAFDASVRPKVGNLRYSGRQADFMALPASVELRV